MNSYFYKRNTCRLCSSGSLEPIMELAPTPAGDKFVLESRLSETQPLFPLTLVFCNTCSFLQLSEVVDPGLLYGDYLYETNISLNLADHFRNYAKSTMEQLAFREPSPFVIEIGCNDGTLLRAFHENGCRVLGVEPAKDIASRVNATGIEVLPTFFNESVSKQILSSHGLAHIICANNVLANIDDLDSVFSSVKALLHDPGVFIFESGYAIDLINNGVLDNIYHEHVSYFSVKPIEKFLLKHGMELISAERVDTKGGSIRFIAQKKGGTRPVAESVKQWLEKEKRYGFNESGMYKDFAKKMHGIKMKVQSEICQQKAYGKTIAAYGASVGVTTLLYFYQLAEAIQFFVDDNKIKQGLYSPGTHIPVFSSDVLYEKKPDIVILFPWRYDQPIIQRHKKFLQQGGKFLVPLPDVRWVSEAGK